MPPKKQRIVYSGVEVNEFIDFKTWNPGNEYTKNIFIKNFNTKSVRVSYEIPKTRFFVTIYPKQILLSPGTSYNLPITFKPLERQQYLDKIKFRILEFDYEFEIPLSGSLPKYNLDFQSSLNLGACNAFENVSKQIKIENTTDLDTAFEWDIIEPFDIAPINGEIKAKSSINVTFTATSLAALVYNGKAVCKYGAAITELSSFKVIDLQVIGKYPHILIEHEEKSLSDNVTLNFNDVPYGKSLTKQLTITNMTPVKTTYFIERVSSTPSYDFCFSCSQDTGVLEPNDRHKISVTFTPNSPHQILCDYFCVYSSGRLTKSTFSCVGTSKGPHVQLEPSYINFGQFEITQTVTRTFELVNLSETDVPFQFDTDSSQSTFVLSTSNGVLKVNEKKTIQVTLKPQFPIIYYKKLSCIIDGYNVLYIDLYGTVQSEIVKPALINPQSLRNYNKLYQKGFSFNPPEKLIELNANGSLNKILNNDSIEFIDLDNLQQKHDNLSYSQYINDSYHSPLETNTKLHVTLDNYYVDFGSFIPANVDETVQKTLNVYNNTKGKLLVNWNTSADKIFTITPNSCEVPPLKTYSFRVTFHPVILQLLPTNTAYLGVYIDCLTFSKPKPGQFYDATLEGYALYKSLCDHTLIDKNFVLPSWCLNVRCTGHSFHQHEERFSPKYTIDTSNIIFPANIVDRPVYRTYYIKNMATHYPLVFDLAQNDFGGDWYAKPLKGLIKPNEHQIFLLKFVPKQEAQLILRCEIKLNEMTRSILNTLLIANGEISRINLSNDSMVYFKPTCKFNTTKQSYEIENQTRAVINYQWKLPYECKNIFSVGKLHDVLLPYEKKKCVWLFTPQKFDKYNMNARLVTWLGDEKTKCKVYNLRLLGTCTIGNLQVADAYKDLGNIIVGSSVTNEILLINNSDCALDYELFVRQKSDENSANSYKYDPCIVELEEYIGHLEAKSRKIIRFRLRPVRVNNYQFTFEYRVIYPNAGSTQDDNDTVVDYVDADDNSEIHTPVQKQSEVLCNMIVSCVYPKLSVTDIKAVGPASNLSKDYLWRLFSIDTLNVSMNCEPNADELIYSIATRQDVNRRIVNKPKTIIDFHFGAALLFSSDTEIGLLIENTGVLATDWSILFPRDLQIDLEYWSQKSEYDVEELEEMKVQDNKIFSVSPNGGRLQPGEAVRIIFTYKHTFTGTNMLPVLLKIDKGREIMINLTGITVPSNSSHVYLPNNKYSFTPVQIGLLDYPIQIYELYNGGDQPAHVIVDTSDLDGLNIKNYSQPVLEYLSDSEIIIPPATSYATKWRFAPLEAKTYQADVVFRCNNDTNIVTFTSIGYDARKLNNFSLKSYKNEEIPSKQLFLIPNQLASLSVDRIVFSEVPLLSRERRVIFLKNNSSQNRLLFSWHVTDAEHVKYVRVQPSRGVLGVNESKMCKVTFLSKNSPAFFNIDLICEIKNEDEISKYRGELRKWESEQRKLWEEFKIDDKELETRLKSSNKKESALLDFDCDGDPRTSQLSLHHFKTIPPILSNNYLHESSLGKIRRLRDAGKYVKKPSPPTPYLLHLNVLSRTQYINEYVQTLVPNESPIKYIDGLLGSIGEMTSNSDLTVYNEDPNKRIHCTDDEYEAGIFVLSDVIRSLISDTNFHALVHKIQYEPIPFFLQYSQKRVQATLRQRPYDLNYEKYSATSHAKVPIEDKPNSNNSNKRNSTVQTAQNDSQTARSSKVFEKSQFIDENPIVENEIDLFDTTQKLKISPVFGSFVETILENAISNILTEAFNQEFSLTSRPRLIALPPKTAHHGHGHTHGHTHVHVQSQNSIINNNSNLNSPNNQQQQQRLSATAAGQSNNPTSTSGTGIVSGVPKMHKLVMSRTNSLNGVSTNEALIQHTQPNMATLKVPAN